jgi:phosphohistidine phosphatase
MKTLILIRHATANDQTLSQQDSARTLSALGQRQAENIAQQLKKKNYLPDYMLCSPAKRTQQTAQILNQTFKLNPDQLEIENILYSGDPDEILNNLSHVTTAKQLFVIGHNPNLSWLAHRLCSASNTIILPPAGVIGMQFEIQNWNELTRKPGRLLFFIEPNHESS